MTIKDILHKENNNLDLIRILLASLVIVGHSKFLNGAGDFWIDPISHFFDYTYSGAIAVKLFFFISGLVITNSYIIKNSASYFIISRVFRLIPALLFVLLITVFGFGPVLTNLTTFNYISNINTYHYILNNILFSTQYDLPGIFQYNLFANAVNGSLWSLRYEIGCYIALLCMFLILGRRNKYYLNIPIALVIIDTTLPNRFIFNFLGNNPEIYLLPLPFALGCLYAINKEIIKINSFLILISILFYVIFKNTYLNEILLVFTCCNILLYVCSNNYVLKLKPKYDISYGIYLWGFLVQQTLYYYFGHIHIGLHCILALIISMMLGLITNLIIEKPFIIIGKSIHEYYKNKTTFN